MKIIAVDNFDRETVADVLIAENVRDWYVEDIVDFLQERFGGEHSDRFYKSVSDDYVLWRGMEELI